MGSHPLDAVSLGLALMFGLLGLPHILMRFLHRARRPGRAHLGCSTPPAFIGYFYLIIPIVGFGAATLVGRDLIAAVDAGGNMAAPLLAERLGGTPFLGFVAAVAFATILAVVAGLTLAGASALSHDIYAHVVRAGRGDRARGGAGRAPRDGGVRDRGGGARHPVQGPERGVHRSVSRSRSALQRQLPGAPCCRSSGAGSPLAAPSPSILVGAFSAIGLIVLSPTIWVDLLGHEQAIFPLRNPALVSMSLSFLVAVTVSLATREPAAEAMFEDEKLRTYLGVGAE